MKGVQQARLAPIDRSKIAGTTAETGEPMIILQPRSAAPEPDTDEDLLAAGYATITRIQGIREVPDDTSAD